MFHLALDHQRKTWNPEHPWDSRLFSVWQSRKTGWQCPSQIQWIWLRLDAQDWIWQICHQLRLSTWSHILMSSAGGPHLEAVTKSLFSGKQLSWLTAHGKQEVRSEQRWCHWWDIIHELDVIYARGCCQTMTVREGQSPVPPCSVCLSIFNDKAFSKAVKQKPTEPGYVKYSPQVHLDKATVNRMCNRLEGYYWCTQQKKFSPFDDHDFPFTCNMSRIL